MEYEVPEEMSITRRNFKDMRDQRDAALDKLLIAHDAIDHLKHVISRYDAVIRFVTRFHHAKGDQVKKQIDALRAELRGLDGKD